MTLCDKECDEEPQCSSLFDNMKNLKNAHAAAENECIIGSLSIGDPYSNQRKIDCYVNGSVNACNFLNDYPQLDFYRRDKMAQQILKAANVHEEGIILVLKAQPCYVAGQEDFIDMLGNRIVLERFYMMLKMESSMWILSTLGGGYSALADCGLTQCAESALTISKKQLKLAKAIGDDVLLARCYIYIGFALAQLGHFEEAFQILLYSRNVAKELKCQLINDLTAALYMKIEQLDTGNRIVQSKKFKRLTSIYETCRFC